MKAQKGQVNDLKKHCKDANDENTIIVAEAGSDNGEKFNGSFIAKVGKIHFKIENGKLIRKF